MPRAGHRLAADRRLHAFGQPATSPRRSSPARSDEEEGPDAFEGTIVDRSLSPGHRHRPRSVSSGKKAKSNPQFKTGFEGLNLYQQRYARGGNQFSVEPPDQALCVGNGYVLEAVNDVLNIFNGPGSRSPGQHAHQHRQRFSDGT